VQDFSAIGMLEYTSIAAGIKAADSMVKAADVAPLFFKTVCPGKFMAAVSGQVAAVTASIQAGREVMPEAIADWFIIPNIHQDVIKAVAGCVPLLERKALGVIETFSVASAIVAADAAVKAADVQILDVRAALGLGGKGFVLLSGDVAAVQAAVYAGEIGAAESGLLVGTIVLPRPADGLFEHLL
jgi:microcompartment protein CcmL/EutN